MPKDTIVIGNEKLKLVSVINNKNNQPIWDVYDVEYIEDGIKKKCKVVVEHNTINNNIPINIVKSFAIDRLKGNTSLIKREEIRKKDKVDIVFLGKIYQKDGRYRYTRHYNSFYCKNGKNALNEFDEHLTEIKNINFIDIFNRLVDVVSKGDKNKLQLVIDEIILFFNKSMNKNYKIKHVTSDDIKKTGETSFMYALKDEMCFSVDFILEIQEKIKKAPADRYYNPDYDDVTFSMYLINTISHELCHCNQYFDYKNGFVNEQVYLNSLCLLNGRCENINYLDRSYEGEAYGNGLALMRELCNENSINNVEYLKKLEQQLMGWNFFNKNILFHETIFYINKIPFINVNGNFEPIINHTNDLITKLNSKYRNYFFSEYPIICLGIEENNEIGRLKTPNELMEQYFNKYIKYKGKISILNEEEIKALEDIYIYLLIPNLTDEIYNELCMKYGNEKMNSFLNLLKEKVVDKAKIYADCYEKSMKGIKKIRKTDKNILQNIDEEYAFLKYKSSKIYMDECLKKINQFVSNSKKRL